MVKFWVSFVQRLSSGQATLIIVLSSVCFGLVPWFAKELLDQGIASPAIAFFRYAITSLLFFSVLRFRGPLRKECFWALFSGLCVGIGWISYVEAIKVVPVSTVGVIYMTYPLFTLLAAWMLVGQMPAKRSVIAGILVLFAAAIAFVPDLSNEATIKLLIAFIAPFTFGLSIAILTDKLHSLSPLQRLSGFATGACIGLIPIVLSLDLDQVIPSDFGQWRYIVGLAFITALIPQFLYTTIAPSIGPAKSGMAGSVELPTMFLIGFLLFGEIIGPVQIMSGALVMIAILITPTISARRRIVSFENDNSDRKIL